MQHFLLALGHNRSKPLSVGVNTLWVVFVLCSNKVASAACSILVHFKDLDFISHLSKLMNTGFVLYPGMLKVIQSCVERNSVYTV